MLEPVIHLFETSLLNDCIFIQNNPVVLILESILKSIILGCRPKTGKEIFLIDTLFLSYFEALSEYTSNKTDPPGANIE
jgi:hypothetical protein